MLSYTSQDGTVLLFPKISDTALVNVTPATFFDKLMGSNPGAYRSLSRPVVTCIYILMGITRRLTESVQSNVRLQAQDMVKRWETSGEWKILGSIMKTEPRPAKTPAFNIHSKSPTFQFDDWTFTVPQMDEKFFDQGVIDTACFSRAFAKQNGQHVVANGVIFAAVGHFVVHHFPDTAAELFINFSDQVHTPNRRTTLEKRVNRSGIRKTNLSNKDISTSPTMTAMTFSDSKSIDQTRSVRRRRRYRATRKKTLGLATPVTTMSSGDVTLGMESQGCHAGNKACQEPESHPHMDEGLEAKGRESRNESGAKVASLQKRRSRSKSEITLSSNVLVTQGTDVHDNAKRKSQKTTHDQNPSVSVARNGVDNAVKKPRAGDLIKADNFLSEVGKELDAKAARKIRFSSHS